jgi:hypothetical protein
MRAAPAPAHRDPVVRPRIAGHEPVARAAMSAARPLAELALPIAIAPDETPLLQIVIDTEEEFDWAEPFARTATAISNIRHQTAAQRIFERHGAKPTYVVDYPVASQPGGFEPLRELAAAGACEIGAHLQPWVNPPFVETVDDFHSFPGNLPSEVERQKLETLSETIERHLGRRPVIYRAGRYGVGPNTWRHLETLGYEIDTSVLPYTDLRAQHGPDFSAFAPQPFWFGIERRLLGIPLSVGHTGVLATHGPALYRFLDTARGDAWRAKALASRLRLLDRVSLTPEGISLAEQKRLARQLLASGRRIFNLSYHSSSLVPGNTPYVRTAHDLERFLARIDGFLDFFVTELKGGIATPLEIKRRLEEHPS